MYNLIYLQKALDDLDELNFYISQDDICAADKMVSSILDAVENLTAFPFIGSSVNERLELRGEYRMIVVTPYLVFYRVIGKNVTIYRVLHSRRYHGALL
ncbi:MAG: type II toxin-antitoxin system RelE/ParE family toxin [Defluviitaleaceae bacterium]|nr:type II toxin-antitoxin system RelE/ParE family toxin [Defluviitaleaceae bacterium]